MKLPYFEEVDVNEPDDYYKVDIEFEGRKLQLDLNIESFTINETELVQMNSILKDLPQTIERMRLFIRQDYSSGKAVKEYLNFHLGEFNEKDMAAILKNSDQALSNGERLLSVLQLKRIGFYPEDENNYAIFDFVTNEEISQYLLVVTIKKDGTLDHITMES